MDLISHNFIQQVNEEEAPKKSMLYLKYDITFVIMRVMIPAGGCTHVVHGK